MTAPTTGALDPARRPGDAELPEPTEGAELPGEGRHFEQPEHIGAAPDQARGSSGAAPDGTDADAAERTEQAELRRQNRHFEQVQPTRAVPDQARGSSGATPGATRTTVLHIASLEVAYGRRGRRGGDGDVLRGVDLEVGAGEIVGVIGETGSGKTTLARAVVGAAPVSGGRIGVGGVDVTGLRGRELRAHRRSGRVQYMFQDPLRSLDPDLTVTELVGEPLAVAGTPRPERRARVAEALRRTGLDPEALGERIPGALSGGQRQRVALARAIVTRPALLLADEPVSALDASNRNHVLRLLDELRRDLGVAIVVISHDLSSLAGIADRMAVLYRGRLVEQGPTAEVLGHPLHPYTALLTASAPRIHRVREGKESALPHLPDLTAPAEPPAWSAYPGACVFAHRCPFADDACRTGPDAAPYPGGRSAACHHPLRPAGAPART